MKNKKLITIISHNDVYKFEEIIEKFTPQIYQIIKKYYNDNNKIYNAFYNLLSEIWCNNISPQFVNVDFLEYIEIQVKNLTSINDYNLFEKKRTFPSLTDSTLSNESIIQRHLLYLREILIEEILIENFKKEVQSDNISFSKILSLRNKIIGSNGYVYNRTLTWNYRLYIYLLDEYNIYIKPLNMIYETILDNPKYTRIKISDIKSFKISNSNFSENPFIIKYNERDELHIQKSKKIEFIELKEYLLKVLKENQIQQLSN